MICSFAEGLLWRLAPRVCEELFWFDRSVSKMTAGDWAGWAQFAGAMGAIYITWRLASSEARRERTRQRAERDRDHKDRVIQYDIAQDTMKDIVEMMFKLAHNMKSGIDAALFWKELYKKMDSDIEILDRMALAPLPTDAAAIDVQTMRKNAYVIRGASNDAINHFIEGNKETALQILKESLEEMVPYAFIERSPTAPSSQEYIDQLYSERRERRLNLKDLE